MSFSLKNVYLSLHHHLNLIKENKSVSISPLTSMALKPVRTPWLQNQDLNLTILTKLYMWKCRKSSHNNILRAVNITATVRLQKQEEVWEDPSPAQMTLPQAELWGQRQTSGEVSRINYCRQINPHIAEIYNAGVLTRESSPPSLPKHLIRQDLHMDKNWLYYFSPLKQKNRSHNQNLQVLKILVDALSSQITLSLQPLEIISYQNKCKTHWHNKMLSYHKDLNRLK